MEKKVLVAFRCPPALLAELDKAAARTRSKGLWWTKGERSRFIVNCIREVVGKSARSKKSRALKKNSVVIHNSETESEVVP